MPDVRQGNDCSKVMTGFQFNAIQSDMAQFIMFSPYGSSPSFVVVICK